MKGDLWGGNMTFPKHRTYHAAKARSTRFVIKAEDVGEERCAFCGVGAYWEAEDQEPPNEFGMVVCKHKKAHLVCEHCLAKLEVLFYTNLGYAKVVGDCPCARLVTERLMGEVKEGQ